MMKRQLVSTLLARPWLRWSTRNGILGCLVDDPLSGSFSRLRNSSVASNGTDPSSDRMQVPVPRYYKDRFYSGEGGLAVRIDGRRGLQAYASPGNALNLKPGVVIYDGVCHLCNAGVNWIIKVDKKKAISFCAVQSRAAEPYLLLCGVTREDVLRRFIFIEGPDSVHQASTAALKVATYLPLPYSALSIFLAIPAPIRDAVYDYVAKRRYGWFGKSSECIIPTEDVLDRFVDKLEIQEKLAFDEEDDEEQRDEKA